MLSGVELGLVNEPWICLQVCFLFVVSDGCLSMLPGFTLCWPGMVPGLLLPGVVPGFLVPGPVVGGLKVPGKFGELWPGCGTPTMRCIQAKKMGLSLMAVSEDSTQTQANKYVLRI